MPISRVFPNKRIAPTSFDGAVSGYCAHGDGGDNSDDIGAKDAKDGFNWNQKRSFEEWSPLISDRYEPRANADFHLISICSDLRSLQIEMFCHSYSTLHYICIYITLHVHCAI